MFRKNITYTWILKTLKFSKQKFSFFTLKVCQLEYKFANAIFLDSYKVTFDENKVTFYNISLKVQKNAIL